MVKLKTTRSTWFSRFGTRMCSSKHKKSHAQESSITSTGNTNGTSLYSLPAELIQQILNFLSDSSDILQFSLTCHWCHGLSLAPLHCVVTITPRNVKALTEKLAGHDPNLVWTYHLQLGDEPHGNMKPYDRLYRGMELVCNGSIATAMPNLRVLDTKHHAPIQGWHSLMDILSCLPHGIVEFFGTVQYIGETDTIAPSTLVFPRFHTIHLTSECPPHRWARALPIIPPHLSQHFPNLTHLSLTLSPRLTDAPFLDRSYFPHLTVFHFHTALLMQWQQSQQFRHLASFLSRHASTLTELRIPSCADIHHVDQDAVFAQIPFRLQRLQCCVHFARMYCHSHDLSSLSALGVASSFHNTELLKRLCPDGRSFSSVRTLAVVAVFHGYCSFPPLSDLHKAFPALVALHIYTRQELMALPGDGLEELSVHLHSCQDTLADWHSLRSIVLFGPLEARRAFTVYDDADTGTRRLRQIDTTYSFRPMSQHILEGEAIGVGTYENMLG
ncbi:hypothetical protein C8Q80DRAFT_193004 [Daedaleopsis nitida]|nr:hypothetical protein C8Q80DRAFT_193004 [Daedaleopsis nitida]